MTGHQLFCFLFSLKHLGHIGDLGIAEVCHELSLWGSYLEDGLYT